MDITVMPGSGEFGVELVQAEFATRLRDFSGRKPPIFLIHDGGGTTFTYHLLEPQERFVFAIANPHWETSKPFEGGIPEMAQLYAGHIRKTVANAAFPANRGRDGRTEILLGGWSLGGLLSLEIARQFASDRRVKVKGVVMIDSVYGGSKAPHNSSTVGFEVDEEGKTKTQILVQKSMAEARRMIPLWNIPVWEADAAKERPRIVLIKASEALPTKPGEGSSSLDTYRSDSDLGWSNHEEDFLEGVVDIPGNHFSLAELSRIDTTSAALKCVCERLDEPL